MINLLQYPAYRIRAQLSRQELLLVAALELVEDVLNIDFIGDQRSKIIRERSKINRSRPAHP